MSLRIQVNPNDEVAVDEVGGGGGNPNYVETIEGTLANPWGDYVLSELIEELVNNNISISLLVQDMVNNKFELFKAGSVARFSMCRISGTEQGDLTTGYCIDYAIANGSLSGAYSYDGFENPPIYKEYEGTLTTILTIIHHPIPAQS